VILLPSGRNSFASHERGKIKRGKRKIERGGPLRFMHTFFFSTRRKRKKGGKKGGKGTVKKGGKEGEVRGGKETAGSRLNYLPFPAKIPRQL